MDRAEKREFVSWLNGAFKDSGSVVVAHYTGLTVAQMSDLRSKMRDAGGVMRATKQSPTFCYVVRSGEGSETP